MFKKVRKFFSNVTGKNAREWEEAYNHLLIENAILEDDLKVTELDYTNLEFINKKITENLDKERLKVREFDEIINNLIDEKLEIQEELKKAEDEVHLQFSKEYELKDEVILLNNKITSLYDEIDFLHSMRERLNKDLDDVKQEKEEIKWNLIAANKNLNTYKHKVQKLEAWLKSGHQELMIDVN